MMTIDHRRDLLAPRSYTQGTLPWVITVAASAGGVRALQTLLRALPKGFPAAVIIVLHRPRRGRSLLAEILARSTLMPVVAAENGQRLEPGTVYIARPDFHLTVTPDCRFWYRDGRRIQFVWSSANPLLESAARVFGGRVIAVVLTGSGSDATDGVQTVKAHGGIVIAQDRATSLHWSMPEAAVKSGAVDYVLPLTAIAPALEAIVQGGSAAALAGDSRSILAIDPTCNDEYYQAVADRCCFRWGTR